MRDVHLNMATDGNGGPVKPLVHDHTEVRVKEQAIYAKVVMRDADGNFWSFTGATFYFDMKPEVAT